MDTRNILSDLRAELKRISQAIVALESLDSSGTASPRRGRPPKAATAQPAPKPHGHRMSPAARKRMSEMMKKRWAKRRKAAAPAKKATPARHMSAGTRKRLSLLAKQRWAARKAGQSQS